MVDEDVVYTELDFEVIATFTDKKLEELGREKLRVETQGCLLNILFQVDALNPSSPQPVHGSDESGGRWRIETTLTEPVSPDEYSSIHSEIQQAIQREEAEVEWLESLRAEWAPSAPPG